MSADIPEKPKEEFKKPVLIGKVGRLPRKINKSPEVAVTAQDLPENENVVLTEKQEENESNAKNANVSTYQLPYTEPLWSGLPDCEGKSYRFEILKSGSIIENVELTGKAFWVFGRLNTCDIYMAHPTISRYHAILQYRKETSGDEEKGFYLYDLNSTHGTFLNKMRLIPCKFQRVKVGHMIKLGCSTRTFILTGPEEDAEEVSELSVTELKQKRAEDLLKREQEKKNAEIEAVRVAEERKKKEEERGIDWGMTEDADEEDDLSENPFAETNNEELYLDDPKKALRGFMEREGFDLEYDCTEQGMGQFLCKVVLPIDDERGRSIVAEVLHKGKKKEAVVQCALEACRILDRHGLLRQAVHESRKRKAKNWEENDFYDSDDDTFYDRTGEIEKKRDRRMRAKVPQQAETYESLVEKEKSLLAKINEIESQLRARSEGTSGQKGGEDEDSLDNYMSSLGNMQIDKQKVIRLKSELLQLKQEHGEVVKLANIARPLDLPPLENTPAKLVGKNKLPLFGKRLKVKVSKPVVESVEEVEMREFKALQVDFKNIIGSHERYNNLKTTWGYLEDITFRKEEFESGLSRLKSFIGDKQDLNDVALLINNISEDDQDEINKVARKLLEITKVLRNKHQEKAVKTENTDVTSESTSKLLDLKKQKRLQRRNQAKQEKSDAERLKGYEEDTYKEDYNMWVPPKDQTGDGRTSLNDKLGY